MTLIQNTTGLGLLSHPQHLYCKAKPSWGLPGSHTRMVAAAGLGPSPCSWWPPPLLGLFCVKPQPQQNPLLQRALRWGWSRQYNKPPGTPGACPHPLGKGAYSIVPWSNKTLHHCLRWKIQPTSLKKLPWSCSRAMVLTRLWASPAGGDRHRTSVASQTSQPPQHCCRNGQITAVCSFAFIMNSKNLSVKEITIFRGLSLILL